MTQLSYNRNTRNACIYELGASKEKENKNYQINMLHKGLDFHILRIFCSNCGWQRTIAHTGCADGKRAIVKVSISKDSAHVLHAKVKEVPINLDKETWSAKFEGYEDLVSKAHEEGLFKALEPYSNLLNGKSCPRCKKINSLNLSQEWKVEHSRY